MHLSTIQQFVVVIYGVSLVLSCPIQNDLSLFYNMVSANGKNMDQNARKISADTQKMWNLKYISTPTTGEGLIPQSLGHPHYQA